MRKAFRLSATSYRLKLTALGIVLLCAQGGDCGGEDMLDSDSMTPLAKGEFERTDGACDTGFVGDVIELLVDALGGDVEISESCATYRREVSTGVTLGEPEVEPGQTPHWSELGGRGKLMADAGLCLLADLARAPSQKVTAQSPPISTVFGPVSVRQTIGYLDWNPAAREFEGYQSVAICAPVIGCLDATRQRFRAIGRESNPAFPAGAYAGDYPIVASYSIEFEVDESAFSFDAELPPIIVPTPYGPVEVHPLLNYGTNLRTVDTPFDGKPDAAHAMFADYIWTPLDDTYGRSGPVALIHLQSGLGFVASGWASQLGLGGRDGRPDAAIWQPNLSETPAPHRQDLDLSLPRSMAERDPVVEFGAGAKIEYSPLDILPPELLSFVEEFSISVEPRLDAYYASQFEVLSREGKRLSLDLGDHDTNRAEFHLAHGVTATAEATLNVRIRLLIEVPTPFGSIEVVDIDKTVPISLGGGEPESHFPRPAIARVGGLNPTQLSYVETLRTTEINEATFITDCLAQDPPPAPEPEPEIMPGDSEEILTDLYPCNICIYVNGVSNEDVDIPGGPVLLEPFGDPNWECDASANGCFDLCRYDPVTDQFVAIEKSATEIQYIPCAVDPPA